MMITMHNLDQAHAQEVFDTIVQHMINQGQPAVREGGLDYCCYRTDNGLLCAAGCLIPEEDYRPVMEGKPFSDHCESIHNGLIGDLQTAHDFCADADTASDFIKQFLHKAMEIATSHDLDWTYGEPDDYHAPNHHRV